jgi:hypothetical protein
MPSGEVIIAIVGAGLAVPPAALVLWRCIRRRPRFPATLSGPSHLNSNLHAEAGRPRPCASWSDMPIDMATLLERQDSELVIRMLVGWKGGDAERESGARLAA